jgi:predicted dehydrogenase
MQCGAARMPDSKRRSIAIIGCGYVADYYLATLASYPWLSITGVFDRDAARLQAFCAYYRLRPYESLAALLEDVSVSIVVNLTNPRSHFEVSMRCLQAGRHVYSEKPLAMTLPEAERLVEEAESRGLIISSAPCSLLGESAQTLWRALREQTVGPARLVYAELDDGMISQMPYREWRSASGAPWPYRDEFEVGCTLEHAGYLLTWLLAFFGPVVSVSAVSACLLPDKVPGTTLTPPDTPDCSIGMLRFEDGPLVRVTTSIIGAHDHSIRIFGDRGVLRVRDCWDNEARVGVRHYVTVRHRRFLSPLSRAYRVPGTPRRKLSRTGSSRMDFAAGIAELARALDERRTCRLSPRFSLHVTEVALALQGAVSGALYQTRSRFEPVQPLEWASR